MRLVEAWLAYRLEHGDGPHAAARYLSKQCGKRYQPSRIWEWSHGSRPVPQNIAKFMRAEILPWLMKREGIVNPKTREKLASILEILI